MRIAVSPIRSQRWNWTDKRISKFLHWRRQNLKKLNAEFECETTDQATSSWPVGRTIDWPLITEQLSIRHSPRMGTVLVSASASSTRIPKAPWTLRSSKYDVSMKFIVWTTIEPLCELRWSTVMDEMNQIFCLNFIYFRNCFSYARQSLPALHWIHSKFESSSMEWLPN